MMRISWDNSPSTDFFDGIDFSNHICNELDLEKTK